MVWRVAVQRGFGIVCRAFNPVGSRWASHCAASSLDHPETIGHPRKLYKVLVRNLDRLPNPDAKFYKDSVRRGFSQHVDETDPERIRQIIDRSVQDVKWVLKKYKLE